MTFEEFREAVDPKVQGSTNLHEVALEASSKLDFFTMFSSITGIIGARGQKNCGSGNFFQDEFALYRQNLGLPANSIDLGLIEGVGYLTDHDSIRRRLLAQGWPPIKEPLLHHILALSVLQQSSSPLSIKNTTQLVAGIPLIIPDISPVKRDIRFSALGATETSTFITDGLSINDANIAIVGAVHTSDAATISKERLLSALLSLTNEQFTRSLGLSEPIESERPLSPYGIDSLVAIELRNWA